MGRSCLSSDQETLSLDRLGFVKNIESVYYVILWNPGTLPLSRFRSREKSFLPVIGPTEQPCLNDDLTYLYQPLSALISKTCQKNHWCS